MKLFNKKLFRVIYTLLLSMLLSSVTLAAQAEPDADLRVYPVEESGYMPEYASAQTDAPDVRWASVPKAMTTGDKAMGIIKKYEGFFAEPYEDAQWTAIGYGSRYSDALEKWPGCTSITEEQAMELLRDELVDIEDCLNEFAAENGIVLNQNQFDALVSFTYNVGTGWTTYRNEDGTWCMLKEMLLTPASNWTEERVQACFGTWRMAGGVVVESLVRRRAEEATLFCTPYSGANTAPDPTPSPVPSPAPKPAFTDVPSSAWYASYVVSAQEKGFMNGKGGGIFDPEGNMTRAEMVMALANFAKADLSRYGAVHYTDVPAGMWYTAAVDWATQAGLINGMGDGTFCPDQPIRREHVCNILARYLKGRGVAQGPSVSKFRDDGNIQDSARDNVYYCASLGLVNGMGDGTFCPAQMATRAQMAKILVCMDQLFG